MQVADLVKMPYDLAMCRSVTYPHDDGTSTAEGTGGARGTHGLRSLRQCHPPSYSQAEATIAAIIVRNQSRPVFRPRGPPDLTRHPAKLA
jgi:hypothetical protein